MDLKGKSSAIFWLIVAFLFLSCTSHFIYIYYRVTLPLQSRLKGSPFASTWMRGSWVNKVVSMLIPRHRCSRWTIRVEQCNFGANSQCTFTAQIRVSCRANTSKQLLTFGDLYGSLFAKNNLCDLVLHGPASTQNSENCLSWPFCFHRKPCIP